MASAERVRSLWERLESWGRDNAPSMLEELQPPADAASLSALETTLGRPLPPELHALLCLHDGEDGPSWCSAWPGGGELLPAQQIGELWDRMLQFEDDSSAAETAELQAAGDIQVGGPVRVASFRRGWVPFMALNGGDVVWYVDEDPAPGGNVGQVIEVDLECGRWNVQAPSLEAYLRELVEALEGGAFSGRDEDGRPTRLEEAEKPAAAREAPRPEPPPEPESSAAAPPRDLNRAIESTTSFWDLERLPVGAEAEVAGVVLGKALWRNRYELSIRGGAITIWGGLGPKRGRPTRLRVRVRVAETHNGDTRRYDVVSFEPLS
ncbi:MAG: SMI1/KNR4 family protein [Proteobacteria bacterium]|nr:SMI1/KNR4 family protein [Pseudomonadota bacterium]